MWDQNMQYKTRHSVEEPVFPASRHKNSWVKDVKKNNRPDSSALCHVKIGSIFGKIDWFDSTLHLLSAHVTQV